jgi:hypothetical protein
MKLYFHKFELTPRRELNYLSSLAPREGVFLKGESSEGVGFCEYFPHPELGDKGVDDFLHSFLDQKTVSQQKAMYLLHPQWSKIYETKTFFNHQLFHFDHNLQSHVIKYKIKNHQDLSFLQLLNKGIKLRLDANGQFDKQSWSEFYRSLPSDFSENLDYIEDPLSCLDWDDISLSRARDFIMGDPFQVKIFKPYREFFPQDNKRVIFSGNMGHGLSNYQAYLELIQLSDLSEHHGIITEGIYEELPELFIGDYQLGFTPDNSALKNYFLELESLEWRLL